MLPPGGVPVNIASSLVAQMRVLSFLISIFIIGVACSPLPAAPVADGGEATGTTDDGGANEPGADAGQSDGGIGLDAGDAGIDFDAGAADAGDGGVASSDGGQSCQSVLGANYEAFETRCDGIDNDCDGIVDVAGPRVVAYGPSGGYWIPAELMTLAPVGDSFLAPYNNGLQKLTWDLRDAGASGRLPWTFPTTTNGIEQIIKTPDGWLIGNSAGDPLAQYATAFEFFALEPDGGLRFEQDGGAQRIFRRLSTLAPDAGPGIYDIDGVVMNPSGDLFFIASTFFAPGSSVAVVLPADGGLDRVVGWSHTSSTTLVSFPAGTPSRPVVSSRGTILTAVSVFVPGGYELAVLEFDWNAELLDAGTFYRVVGRNQFPAAAIASPRSPQSIADTVLAARLSDGGVFRVDSSGDAGWWAPSSITFDVEDDRGEPVIAVSRFGLDGGCTTVLRRGGGSALSIPTPGRAGDNPESCRLHPELTPLGDGGVVLAYWSRGLDGGSGHTIYAARACMP